MAAVTIHSDFGVQKDKICHCSYSFSISLSWSAIYIIDYPLNSDVLKIIPLNRNIGEFFSKYNILEIEILTKVLHLSVCCIYF